MLEASRNQRWISLGPRLMVQVLLLATFLYFFGFLAVTRFERNDVIVVQTTKDTNGIPIPAISLAAVGQIIGDTCFQTNASIEDCIEQNTINRSQILKRVFVGYKRMRKINLTPEILSEDFTSLGWKILHPELAIRNWTTF